MKYIGERMKNKRKILTIATVFLFVFVQFSIVEASETKQQEGKQTLVELAAVNEEGIFDIQKIYLNEEELNEFQEAIERLIDKLEKAESIEKIEEIISNDPISNIPFIGTILSTIFKKFSLGRGFVISSGKCYKLNPLKRTKINLIKRLSLWHYLSFDGLNARTIVVKPLKFDMKILRGTQVGLMRKFFGIHVFISKPFPAKSSSFFLGTAKRINGIQLAPIGEN